MARSYYVDRVGHAGGTSISLSLKRVLALILLTVMMAFSTGVMTASRNMADAGVLADMFCSWTSGVGLNTQANNFTSDILEGKDEGQATAKMSIMDLYAGSMKWTTYNGTPNPSKIAPDKGNIFGLDESLYDSTQNDSIIKNSEASHSAVKCLGSLIFTTISIIPMAFANLNTRISSFFVSKAVDPDFICQDVKNNAGVSCINLLAIIGGNGNAGSDGGIIGRLYSGLYQGLVALVWLGVAVWVAWTGIAKRKLTAALGGLFTAFIIFGAGIIALNNPLLLAQAPMRIGTTLGGCVIEGINGVNCMSSSSSDPNGEPSTGTECYVDDAKKVDVSRALSLIARQSTCSIWKAFILEPWSIGEFGYGYDALYYKQADKTGEIFQNQYTKGTLDKVWGEDSDSGADMSVSLYASDANPLSTCSKESPKFTYKNLALYQLNLQSTLHTCNGATGDQKYHSTKMLKYNQGEDTYADWYWMVLTMNATTASQDKGDGDISHMWKTWNGDRSFTRITVANLAVIASLGGGVTLISLSLLAIMYLFVSILLTAFAPLFFLIGIMPGQGKKIFLGYLEKMVSTILKYFACILWMMVTVELYDAVLSNSQGLGGTLIFVIIVTMAMFMYRKEFLNMIGQANMGGVKLGSKIEDKITERAKGAAKFAALTGGSYATGYLAGGENHESYKGKSPFGRVKTLGHNVRDRNRAGKDQGGFTAMQQVKRGNGVMANAARSYDNIMDSRRSTTRARANENVEKVAKAKDALEEHTIDMAVASDMRDFDKKHPKASAEDRAAEEKKRRDEYTNHKEKMHKSTKQITATKEAELGGKTIDNNGNVTTVKEDERNELAEIKDGAIDKKNTLINTLELKDADGYLADSDYRHNLEINGVEITQDDASFSASLADYRNAKDTIDAYAGRDDLSDQEKRALENAQKAQATNSITIAMNQTVNKSVADNSKREGFGDIKNVADLNNEIQQHDDDILAANTHEQEALTINKNIQGFSEMERQLNIAEKNANRANARTNSGRVSNRTMNSLNTSEEVGNLVDANGNFNSDEVLDEMAKVRKHHRIFKGRFGDTDPDHFDWGEA